MKTWSGGIAPLFLTSARDEVNDQLNAPAALPSRKLPLGGPKSEPQCHGEEKYLAPAGNQTQAGQPLTPINTQLALYIYYMGCAVA
jgi:hypothetical protein